MAVKGRIPDASKPVEHRVFELLGADEDASEALKVNVYTPHANQKKIIQSPARFKVIVCGRRFGKTTFALNTIFISALLKQNGTFWYIAPTYRQAKQIAWRMLVKMYHDNDKKLFFKAPNESNLSLIMHNGTYIELKGADNEDSLRGVGLDGVVLDEMASIKPDVWETVAQPMLADSKGWAIFIGTPKGYNHFYDLYEKAKVTPQWEAFHFTTYDNSHISGEEIDTHKNQMTEDYFAQEYMADFRKFTGLVYKHFERTRHVIDPFDIPSAWPKWRTIDAGYTNPFVCLWVAQDPETKFFYIYDEHYLAQQTTRYHSEIINGKSFGQYFRGTFIDPSAKQQLAELGQYGIYCMQAINVVGSSASDDYKTGISRISELLKPNPLNGLPQLYVFNTCRNVIKEFESYRWEEKRSGHGANEIPHKEDDHAMDSLRYLMNSMQVAVVGRPKREREVEYVPRNRITGY